MKLLAFGINHKTAPVDIRERVAFAPERLHDALQELTSLPKIDEAAILSTCNRTELYCCMNDDDPQLVTNWFSEYHHLNAQEIRPYIYMHPDNDAVKHLLRVASGLDSLVLGEPQILGQVKSAYREAASAGTVGTVLNKLCQHTFNVAKQVRTDTAIGASPVSVAYAAVNLAKRFFSGFEKHTALLLGAGETIELTARHLREAGIGRIIIANRTVERAHKLAEEVNGFAIALSDMPAHLAEADLIISSTASPLPILGKGAVESALKSRKHKPIVMVDIAVPRDIEQEVGNLADVYLYTVDDLQDIIDEGLRSRREAARQAEDIIESQTGNFMGWVRSQDAVNMIRQYREYAEATKQQEIKRALQLLANGGDAEQVIERIAHNLLNKLTHQPMTQIREAGQNGDQAFLSAAARMLNLKDPNDPL